MNCPKCRTTPLKQGKVKDSIVRIDYCKQCKGIWFDRFEIEKLVEHALWDPRIPRDAVKQQIDCPKCDQPLYLFTYPGTTVAVDMCKECRGLWLDAGELKQIQATRAKLAESGELPSQKDEPGLFGKVINAALSGFMI